MRYQSRYLIDLFTSLYSDRLTPEMDKRIDLLDSTLFIISLLKRLDDDMLDVRMNVSPKSMKHVSGHAPIVGSLKPKLPG